MSNRRVVITGIGMICGVGHTAPEIWQGLLEGRSGMGPIQAYDPTGFSMNFAAEVRDFDPVKFMDKKDSRKMGRFMHFAMAASQEAMAQSGLEITDENSERVGVYIGSGIGGFDVIEREHRAYLEGGPRKISPFFIPATIINLASGWVSIKYGARGPNEACATACTTGAHAIGDAYRIIQRDDADAMIAGGTEASITPLAVGGFASMRALSTRNDDPTHASRPWDRDRDGFVIGEGAGIVILEELEFAKKRGANIMAEVIGYGMSGDAFHITGMAENGDGCFRAMNNALRSAKVRPEQVDYVNAHATSTPLGDRLESEAIGNVFGEHATSHKLRISSTKSMTGHLLGGAGGLEAGISVLAIQNGKVPPTTNLENVDPECRLNYTPNTAVDAELNIVASNSFGFGGTNGCLVFRKFEG